MSDITIRIKADTADAEKKINRLNRALGAMQARATGSRTASASVSASASSLNFFGVDARQMQKMLDYSKRFNTQNVQDTQHASAARQRIAEIEARHSARMSEIQERARVQAANAAARALESSRRREYQEYVRLERQKTAAANAEARRRNSFSLGGNRVQNLGQSLTFGVTAPIAAAAYKAGSYGLDIQALRNQLTAFEGNAAKAEDKLVRLRAVSDQFAGATRETTYSVYSLLKPLNTMSDTTIEKTIGALGKLQLGFKNVIPSDFAYNLTQIFGQGFEEQDIKQAIGQVPKFREYLVKAFGTDDNETLKQMKANGKLTMDQFFTGIAEAVQNDSALKGLQEPVALRMQKFFEKAFESIEPIANVLVDVLSKAIEFATPLLGKLSDFLKSLSPSAQYAALAFAAIAAAIGPVILVVAKVIAAFEAVAGVMGTISAAVAGIGLGPLALIIGAVTLALAEWAATAYLAYKAWTTNFGGIQTYTLAVWNTITTAVSGAIDKIYSLVREIGGQIVGWWRENWPLIQQIVEKVSDAIKSRVDAFLNAVAAFWQIHGARITAFAKSAWALVETVITGAVTQIGNVVRLALQVINGDWSGAWTTLLGIIQTGARNAVQIFSKLVTEASAALRMIIPIARDLFLRFVSTTSELTMKAVTAFIYILATLPEQIVRLVPKFVAAGASIASAIWEGIKQGLANQDGARLMQEAGGVIEVVGMSAEAAYVPVNKFSSALSGLGDKGGKKLKDKLTEIQQLRKDAAEAAKSLSFLYGNTEAQGLTVGIDRANDEKSKLTELLKLRAQWAELAAKQGALPVGSDALEAQIKVFKDAENGIAAAKDMLEEFKNGLRGIGGELSNIEKVNALLADPRLAVSIDAETTALLRQKAVLLDSKTHAKEFAEAKKQLNMESVSTLSGLRVEIDTLGMANEIDIERVKRAAEIEKFKRENVDKFNPLELAQLVGIKEAEAARYLEMMKIIQGKKDIIEADRSYKDLLDELNGKMSEGVDITEADRVAKQLLTDAYKNLTQAQRDSLLARAAEVDAMRAAKEAQEKFKQVYDDTTAYIEDKLHVFRDSGFKGLFKSILQDIEDFLIRAAAKFLASKFFQFLQGKGINVGGGSGGSWIDRIFGGGMSGSSGGGGIFSGSQGGGIFNFGLPGSSGGGSGSGGVMNIGGFPVIPRELPPIAQTAGRNGGSQSGGGGIGLAGGLMIGGMAAQMIGSAIGGRAGSFLSNIGGGVAMGAQIGSMIPGLGTVAGALIGGGVGLLRSILGGDPKRKIDRKENMPKLQQGFQDSAKEFADLIADVNALRADPDSALSRGRELRASIASGFGIDFQSKKYKKLAQSQIAQQLASIDKQPDGLMEQLKKAVDMAKTAGERDRRILPEFADGGAVSQFFRNNFAGLVPGQYDRRDDKLIKVSGNEVVLTPNQWQPITPYLQRAGVPGFADGGLVMTSPAAAPSSGPINVTIVVEGEIDAARIKSVSLNGLSSPEGERAVVSVVKTARLNNVL